MKRKILFTAIMSILLYGSEIFAGQISVQAAIGQQEAYVGEPIDFQIQVSGSSHPSQPDLSELKKNFIVKPNGGGPNNSTSVTIINGKMTKTVKNEYIFAYTLTAKKAGAFIIPSIRVNVEGRQYRTSPISVLIRKPTTSDDYKLRLKLSKEKCYVGEPVKLTVVWYLNKDVRGFDITLPILDEPDLFIADPPVNLSGAGVINLPVDGKQVPGIQSQERLDGKIYTTISFSKILIPKKAGLIDIAPANIVCESLVGYRSRTKRSSDPFDMFADFSPFGSRRRAVYKRVVVQSNGLQLNVLPLPEKGRPGNFAGHIGKYHITTTATPRDVSVGDPITLKIIISGPEYLDHVAPPDLAHQEDLIHDFKVPEDIGDGEVTQYGIVFTQTLRALRPDVKEIPPIKLPYFDPDAGKYKVAESAAIPIKVKYSKVFTAADIEGLSTPTENGKKVESLSRGIAQNYTGNDLLINQSVKSYVKLWLPIIIVPPLSYLSILLFTLVLKHRRNNEDIIKAKGAMGKLQKAVNAVSIDSGSSFELLNILQEYLRTKLKLGQGVLTFNDVKDLLVKRGVNDDLLSKLKDVFTRCEAGHFGGGMSAEEIKNLKKDIISVAHSLDKKIRKG